MDCRKIAVGALEVSRLCLGTITFGRPVTEADARTAGNASRFLTCSRICP